MPPWPRALRITSVAAVSTAVARARLRCLGRPRVVQPRDPQRLVGVDVADPGDQVLVQQRPLDPGALGAQPRHRGREVELRVEGVAADVRDLLRQLGPAGREGQPAEHPLVDEAEPGVAVGEPEQHPGVGHQRRGDRVQPELAAHPQVGQDGVAVGQRQPEILAAAARLGEGPPGQRGGEVVGARQVPTDRSRVQDLHRGDPAVGDPGGQTAPDDLDLGELGHQVSERRRGRCRERP